MSAASRPRSVMWEGEQDLYRPGRALVPAGKEGLPVLVERVAVGHDRCHVDAPLAHEVEVDLHRVPAFALELLDSESIRSDDGDLLEVQRRPLEAAWHLDAGDDERTARGGDPDADLDGLRVADGVVDDVDTAAVEPGHPEPGRQHLGVGLGTDAGDDVLRRLVRYDDVDAENGSASTASSSFTSSGIGMHIDSWAGTNGAKPPVAALLLPVWMPGGIAPRAKLRQMEYWPSWHSGQGGVMPRGPQDSHGFRTTRSPTRRVRTPGPTRSIVPTTSCPSTCGKEISAVIGLSMLPFRKICL